MKWKELPIVEFYKMPLIDSLNSFSQKNRMTITLTLEFLGRVQASAYIDGFARIILPKPRIWTNIKSLCPRQTAVALSGKCSQVRLYVKKEQDSQKLSLPSAQ